jgi:hypothetical protein
MECYGVFEKGDHLTLFIEKELLVVEVAVDADLQAIDGTGNGDIPRRGGDQSRLAALALSLILRHINLQNQELALNSRFNILHVLSPFFFACCCVYLLSQLLR